MLADADWGVVKGGVVVVIELKAAVI